MQQYCAAHGNACDTDVGSLSRRAYDARKIYKIGVGWFFFAWKQETSIHTMVLGVIVVVCIMLGKHHLSEQPRRNHSEASQNNMLELEYSMKIFG